MLVLGQVCSGCEEAELNWLTTDWVLAMSRWSTAICSHSMDVIWSMMLHCNGSPQLSCGLCSTGCAAALVESKEVLVDYASPDVGISVKRVDSSPVCGGIALDDGDLNQKTCSPAIVLGMFLRRMGLSLSRGSPHRPLISTGVDGDAISVELGLNPGVDGSTSESIAWIARKYSLVDVVDGLLNKAPFEFQEVRSIPLSGCPVKGSEASVAEAEMICDSGRGLELALPNVDPYAGDPLSDDYGIQQSPDHHMPCCSKASCAPVGPSSGNVATVQGLSPCNPCSGDPAGLANRSIPSPAPVTGCSRLPYALSQARTDAPQVVLRTAIFADFVTSYYFLVLIEDWISLPVLLAA
ncbi:hypothetical protein Nepgr_030926 [Nepenthes gracilis]|uniref:Uncharacterized protein n=1 Tax=Nepenthes gracilis TaxID=150966 RepID=A0AAD3Y4P6_NEPGR|nr:hypothetical protein Nepgr_030926 [Nepenthes gracilis]